MADLDHIEELVRSRSGELERLLQRLIRAQSPNPPGDEFEVAQILARELQSHADVYLIEPAARRVSVVARLGSGNGVHVVCNAHLDTVPIDQSGDWSVAPYGGVSADGYIWGRGAVDHKSPVAALTIAAQVLESSGLLGDGRLTLVFDADEEAGGTYGAAAVYQNEQLWPTPVDFALYASPSSWNVAADTEFGMAQDNVFTGSLGSVRYRIPFPETTHYLTRKQWRTPAEAAVDLISRLDDSRPNELQWWWRGRWRIPQFDGTNLVLERLMTPGEDSRDSVAAGVASLVEIGKSLGNLDVEILEIIPPASCPGDHPFAAAVVKQVELVRRRKPWVGTLGATTGMSALQQGIGAPCVMAGFGELEFAHAVDERIAIGDLVDEAVVYARVLADTLETTSPKPGSRPSEVPA